MRRRNNIGCGICGRGSCCTSFHPLEEQSSYDEMADRVKDLMAERIERAVQKT